MILPKERLYFRRQISSKIRDNHARRLLSAQIKVPCHPAHEILYFAILATVSCFLQAIRILQPPHSIFLAVVVPGQTTSIL